MPRSRTYRTDAVILRRSDFGEADRLVTLYTRERGKMSAVAKGARKPMSKKTGHVELFAHSALLLAQGRDLDIITQAELVNPHRALSEDLTRASYAAYVAELVDALTPERERNTGLFNLLTEILEEISVGDNLLLAARYFELRLLSISGFQPQLFVCVSSGEPIEQEDQFFSAVLGGLLKPETADADPRAKPISAGAVKVLRHLQTHPWQSVANLRLRDSLHRELEQMHHYYLSYILEKKLRSAEFLRRLRFETETVLKQ